MVSKRLMGIWAFLDFCLMAAGIVAIVFSMVWREWSLLRQLVISAMDLTAGLALGIMLLITFAFSIGVVIQPTRVTWGLVALNVMLIMDSIAVITIGSIVWFFTLRERANFAVAWSQQSSTIIVEMQDKLSCCGYFNSTNMVVNSGFCVDPAFAAKQTACVDPVTTYADYTLNNIFTSIYGFQAIILCFFLATICVIKKRHEDERFRKIDAKRGGLPFV